MRRVLAITCAALAATGFYAVAGSSTTPKNPSAQTGDFLRDVEPFLKKNCLLCHNDQAKVGDLSLTPFHSTADIIANRTLWERISARIKNGEMPPKGIPRPSDADSNAVSGWIDSTFDAIDRAAPPDPGRPTAHRL